MTEPTEHPNRLADARLIYEGTQGMSLTDLATITGFPKKALAAQSRAEGWVKQLKSGQTEEAAAAVARFAEWKALSDQVTNRPAEDGPANDISRPVADALSDLLERHRKEWTALRAMTGEAMRLRESNPHMAFERAKLAKILTEQIDIVQKGERRAWGIETSDQPSNVVIIERD